jgi:hypothetical protein
MNQLEELEMRIKKLEDERIIFVYPQYQTYYPPQDTTSPLHYHGTIPCYNNPCYNITYNPNLNN